MHLQAILTQASGQCRRAIAALACGGVTPGTPLVVEPLSGGDRRRVGAERIARRVGLLCGDGQRERERGPRKQRESVSVYQSTIA